MPFPIYFTKVLWSKWLLTCAALVGCLIGFGLIVEDQFFKFINRKTGVSVSYELKKEQKVRYTVPVRYIILQV